MKKDKNVSLEENFFGTATVGDRGQVVIPADARKQYNINPGEKVLVIGHPGNNGIFICKLDTMRDFFSNLLEDLDKIESTIDKKDRTEEV